jgi:hypothetical protein
MFDVDVNTGPLRMKPFSNQYCRGLDMKQKKRSALKNKEWNGG